MAANGTYIASLGRQGVWSSAYRPPTRTLSYTVFLSSGSDLSEQRDQFKDICDQVNVQLARANLPVRIDLARWEDQGSFKVQKDANERFRQLAIDSHLTVVLLGNSIRPGTQDELEAALAEDEVQLEVLWMRAAGKEGSRRPNGLRKLEKYLLSKKDQVIWTECAEPGSSASAIHMYRIVTAFVFQSIALLGEREGSDFNEERG